MKIARLAVGGILFTAIFGLAGCGGGDTTSTTTKTGSLSLQIPSSFPYNVTQTINVNLASSPYSANGLGYSNVTLHLNPSSTEEYLTISPSSTCLAIQPSSTATSCNFIVTNNHVSAQNALDNAGYYVTGQLSGNTITSPTVYPSSVNPPPPPPSGTYWDITITNNTAQNQYFFVFGQNLQTGGDPYEVVVFDSLHYGTARAYSSSTNYGSDNDSIVLTPGSTTVHIPYGLSGGRAYISNSQMTGLNLTSGGGITTPDPTDTGGANYNKIYDDFEFTYAEGTGAGVGTYSAVINQTQVDMFGLSLCLQGSDYSPITQAGFCTGTIGANATRNSIINTVTNYFSTNGGSAATQWESLILKNGGTTLRIMNPGSTGAILGQAGITAFENYLSDSSGASGSKYANALLTEGTYSASDSLVVKSPDETITVSGNIINSGGVPTYSFTCSPACGGTQTMPLTTVNLLTGAPPSGANAGVTAAYQMISSAFMATQLPTATTPITQTSIRAAGGATPQDVYYKLNDVTGVATNQYSLFSAAFAGIQLQGTYTYAYNDVLGVSSTMTDSLASATTKPGPVTVTINPYS